MCRYVHNVTRAELGQLPPEPIGGILADDMGLGKTLTSIALIASSLDRATQFKLHSAFEHDGQPQLPYLGATLIVVPNASKDYLPWLEYALTELEVILESWIKEFAEYAWHVSISVARISDHA